jgi:methylated-DNA-[protein]-cysteine S-methyltransferase
MRFSIHQSPVGPLLLGGDEHALTRLAFAGEAAIPDSWQLDDQRFSAERRQLDEYFTGARSGFGFALRLEGAPFDRAVWKALREIPYGTTASYGEIAERIGRPGRARAVGAANARNPIAIVVPCHRVIGANGALTGYGGGLGTKRALLALEGSMLSV